MQISESARQALQNLLTPADGSPPNYPAAYQIVLNDLQNQIASNSFVPSSDDDDVLRWLQIAEQINSGQLTEAALGVRINNAVAEKIENNQDIAIFGQQEQASSNAVAASFFSRILGANGVVPPFSGSPTAIMFIDAQAGLGSLGLGPEAWAGAIPSALAPSFWTGFNGDNYTSTLTVAQTEQAILFHGVTATALAAYYAGQAEGLDQAQLSSVVQYVIDSTVNGLQKTGSDIASAYQYLQTSISNGVTTIESDFQGLFNNIGSLISGSDSESQLLITDQSDDESIYGDNLDTGGISTNYDIGPGLDISVPTSGVIGIESIIANSDGSSTVNLYDASSEEIVASVSISSGGGTTVSVLSLLSSNQNPLVLDLTSATFEDAQLTENGGVEVQFSLTTETGTAAVIVNTDGSYEFGLDTGSAFEKVNEFVSGGLTGDTETISVNNGIVIFNTEIAAGATAELASDAVLNSVADEYSFASGSGLLELDSPEKFSGTISNFQSGDTIDLSGITEVTGASFGPNNELILQEGTAGDTGATSLVLNLGTVASDSGDSVLFVPDGSGGTDIIQSSTFTSASNELLLVNDATSQNLSNDSFGDFQPGDTLDLEDVGPPSSDPAEELYNFDISAANQENFLLSPDGDGGTDVTAYSDSSPITFSGSDELLIINSSTVTGTISGLQAGDAVYLNTDANAYAVFGSIVSSNTLSLQYEYDGTELSLTLNPNEDYSQYSFPFDGTVVVVEPRITKSGPDDVTVTSGDSSATVEFSTTDIQFPAIRNTDPVLEKLPVTISYVGGINSSGASYVIAGSRVELGAGQESATVDVSSNFYENVFGGAFVPPSSGGTTEIPVYLNGSKTPSVYITTKLDYYDTASADFSVNGTVTSLYDLGIVHVGQTTSIDIEISNVATGTLTDSLYSGTGSLGNFTAENAISDIASGGTGTVTVGFSAAVDGRQSVDESLFGLVSHDSELPDVPATVTPFTLSAEVYNYASPELEVGTVTSDGTVAAAPDEGLLTQTGDNSYTLDFGTISESDTIDYYGNLLVENTASPVSFSDYLAGSVEVSGSGFLDGLLSSVGLTPGGSFAELGSLQPDLTSVGTNTVTVVFDPTSIDSAGTTSLAPITLTVTDDVVAPCFAIGTRIATPSGESAVEELAIGKLIQTQRADLRAVTWLGHRRIDCRRHPRPCDVWPVRIAPDTFGPGMPHRELFLSPDHAVFVEGVLIPVKHLINGSTIVQVPVDEVTYYHVELPEHDLLLAEGLPAESYLDTGDRSNFSNGGEVMRLFPDFGSSSLDPAFVRDARSYAPLVVCGPELEAARRIAGARVSPSVSTAAAA